MEKWDEFWEKAKQWSHPLPPLADGQQVDTHFTLNDLFQAREIVSNATPQQRKKRQASFFHPDYLLRARLGQGVHDRCEAVAFADGILTEEDRQGLERHLPLRMKATSIPEKVVRAGEIWNLTISPHYWNLDDREDVYRLLNIGKLTLEAGAALVVEGNVFSLLVQELHTPTDCPPDLIPQIRIMPTPYSVDFGNGPLHGQHGEDGKAGKSGQHGTLPQLGGSILGLYMNGSYTVEEFRGKDGENGESGTDGNPGRNGGMCKLSEITLRELNGPLWITVEAGNGGNGGKGGEGGSGGDGGNGTPAYRLYTGWSQPGTGGIGGDAGCGGNGGKGGNGGIGSNVYLNIPAGSIHHLGLSAKPSKGGRGGEAGKAGLAGEAGMPGESPEPLEKSKGGKTAMDGTSGRNGHDRNPPVIFLNEEPQNVNAEGRPIALHRIPLIKPSQTAQFSLLQPQKTEYVTE